jgi:glycosyltransferase involved in cell wall biosynthesis
MRVLLTANASYVPPRGGATRSNLRWLELLAERGHRCRVVASELARDPAGKAEQLLNEEIHVITSSLDSADGVEEVEHRGITFYSAADPSARIRVLEEQIRSFRPDWVLVSSEDLGQVLLREAQQEAPGRVIYLAHTPQLFPFGPASWNPDAQGRELVQKCAAIVAIGRHTAQYIQQHTGCHAEVIHPPIYGGGPFENYGSFDDGLATLINPCAVKGISIFLAVAEQLPELSFGALPGWGTTTADRKAMESLPNISLLANVKDIGQILSRTRVLLMPSLWYEGFGLSVMEAMLHGIPVISSDSGGLLEAKLGTRFVLPVRPINHYQAVFDEHGLPDPVTPPQGIRPWLEALRSLLSDRAVYEQESAVSRERALEFVNGIRPERMEEFLLSLKPAAAAGKSAEAASVGTYETLANLSADKRALLLQRLRKKTSTQSDLH